MHDRLCPSQLVRMDIPTLSVHRDSIHPLLQDLGAYRQRSIPLEWVALELVHLLQPPRTNTLHTNTEGRVKGTTAAWQQEQGQHTQSAKPRVHLLAGHAPSLIAFELSLLLYHNIHNNIILYWYEERMTVSTLQGAACYQQ